MALAMSREAPPPTPSTLSAFAARYASPPRMASASVGFCSKSLKTCALMPACSSSGVTKRKRPAFRMPLSVTRSGREAPARFSSLGSSRIDPFPYTMRVGKLITLAMKRSSDDLEVPLQLPLRHRALELPALPVAGAHVMVHERLAEKLAGLGRRREPRRRLAQRRRKEFGPGLVAVPLR